MPVIVEIDPLLLRLPGSRLGGADPIKLTRQFSKFGLSTQGMPDLVAIRGMNGEVQLLDGVTRATRVAKFLAGKKVRVVITHDYPTLDLSSFPTVGDCLP